jgi:hypothetical protein
MLIEIIKNTPVWVFMLFSVLLWLGLNQSKTRTIKITTSLILPCIMLILSLHSILTVFPDKFFNLALWLSTMLIACYIGLKLNIVNVNYRKPDKHIEIEGSWLPLILIIFLFITKYTVGVLHSLHSDIIAEPSFIIIICGLLGLFNGLFTSRGLIILKSIK